MNDSTLLAGRELLGYPGARVELHVEGREYTVEITDPVGCEVWRPTTKREAKEMYFHPFVYGYDYRQLRDEDETEDDAA